MLDEKALVSIIIPIFNAENSIHNCMESILDQTYQNIEMIMVNDGSTDQCKAICDHYASIDKRIKVIHQNNEGSSSARNTGMKRATGQYIQFVDADDYIKPNMTETLLQAMTGNIQFVICGYQSIHRTTLRKYIPSITGVYEQADLLQHIGELYKHIILPSPCNKLYDATLIKNFGLHFQEDVKVGEDLLFNLAYLNICPVARIIDDILYNYIIQDNHSLSRAFNRDFFTNQQMLHDQVKTFLRQKDYYAGKNRYFLNVIYANSVINSLSNLFHHNNNLARREKQKQIHTIVADVHLEQDTNFTDSLQARIVGQMIKRKSTQQIYLLFKFKMSSFGQWVKGKIRH